MTTWVVCSRCGKVQEIAVTEQLPDGWRRLGDDLRCPSCVDVNEDEANGDLGLSEEVISLDPDALDEGHCEVCGGPCQGH